MENIDVKVTYTIHGIKLDINNRRVTELIATIDQVISSRSIFNLQYGYLMRKGTLGVVTTTLGRIRHILRILGYVPNFIISTEDECVFKAIMRKNDIYEAIGIDSVINLTDEQEKQIRDIDRTYNRIAKTKTVTIEYSIFSERLFTSAYTFRMFLESKGLETINIMKLDEGGRSEDEGYLIPAICKKGNEYYPVLGSCFDDFEYTPFPDDYIFLPKCETYEEAFNTIHTVIKESIDKIRNIFKEEDTEYLEDIEEYVGNDNHVFTVANSVDEPELLDKLLINLSKLKESYVYMDDDYLLLTDTKIEEYKKLYPNITFKEKEE